MTTATAPQTETFDLSRERGKAYDAHRPDPARALVGRSAVFTTYDGDRLVGTIEPMTAWRAGYPTVRFPDGKWARLDNVVELVTGTV